MKCHLNMEPKIKKGVYLSISVQMYFINCKILSNCNSLSIKKLKLTAIGGGGGLAVSKIMELKVVIFWTKTQENICT